VRAARPIPPRRRDATKFAPIQSAFPRQSDPQLRTPFRTPIVSPHRTRLFCTQAFPVVGALSPWLLSQPLPALRVVSTPRTRGWRALSAIIIHGRDPRSPRPRLGFSKVRMGCGLLWTDAVYRLLQMRHDVRARSERLIHAHLGNPSRPSRGPWVSLVFAHVRTAPFGATSQAQRATKTRRKGVIPLHHQQAGQVIPAGRQTPSKGPAHCEGDPSREPAEHSLVSPTRCHGSLEGLPPRLPLPLLCPQDLLGEELKQCSA